MYAKISPRLALASLAVCGLTAAGPLANAQSAENDRGATADFSAPSANELSSAAPAPPVRPQVPFRNVTDEVVVYGTRPDALGLPDSIREDIWRDERRQMQAMLLERERLSNSIAIEGFDALLGDRLSILPSYDPTQERAINYGVNDSTPVGVINLFGAGIGKKNK